MNAKLLKDYHFPRFCELPTMDLYMEQVVSLLNDYLNVLKIINNDKIVTNTMINNYVKHGIVQAPIKKKYTREHIAYLIVVFVLKNVFTMDEISQLIKVQIKRYPIDQAYDYFCNEFEVCLHQVFENAPIEHFKSVDEGSASVCLLRQTVQAIVFALYAKLGLSNQVE